MPLTRLQFKLNAVVLPIVLVSVGILAWADYRYAFISMMDAHGIHTSEAQALGPIEADTAPRAVAARSLGRHVVFGAAVALGLFFALNAAVSVVVLRPIRRIQEQIDRMARGLWRPPPSDPVGQDELGALVAGFGDLGLQMEAVVGHLLQSERLASRALVSTRLNAAISPALDTLRGAVAELHAGRVADTQQLASGVAQATATILAALHELDAPFSARPKGQNRAALHQSQGAVG